MATIVKDQEKIRKEKFHELIKSERFPFHNFCKEFPYGYRFEGTLYVLDTEKFFTYVKETLSNIHDPKEAKSLIDDAHLLIYGFNKSLDNGFYKVETPVDNKLHAFESVSREIYKKRNNGLLERIRRPFSEPREIHLALLKKVSEKQLLPEDIPFQGTNIQWLEKKIASLSKERAAYMDFTSRLTPFIGKDKLSSDIQAVREYGVPDAIIQEVLETGKADYIGMIHNRPSTETSPADPRLDIKVSMHMEISDNRIIVKDPVGRDMKVGDFLKQGYRDLLAKKAKTTQGQTSDIKETKGPKIK